MTVYLSDIVDVHGLELELEAGYVNERYHPMFPELAILNYANKTQFDQRWNDVTRNTRGLIYNRNTAAVVSRSFPKWFNVGDDAHVPNLTPDEEVSAYTKWDGSLGILYVDPNGYPRIATRGSFDSEQARHATERLHASGEAWLHAERIESGFTPVFEIIYPDNRIVVDYGDTDALIPLGMVRISDGRYFPSALNLVEAGTLRDVLALPYRGDEGFIVHRADGSVVKWKHDQYKELHRVVSNLTVKEVWRQLRADTFEKFAAALPDEFHQWARDTAGQLNTRATSRLLDADYWWAEVVENGDLATRKDQAIWIQTNVPADLRGLVFRLLDRKDVIETLWRDIEPKGAQSMRDIEEAA